MKIYGMCSFELIVHRLSITMDTVVVDLNCLLLLIPGNVHNPWGIIFRTGVE